MKGDKGFTLIELMFAVAVVGILSVVAVIGYKGYVRKARSSEVITMFGEFKAKEESYHVEFGKYLAACVNPSGSPVGYDCDEGDYWPTPLPGKGQPIDATGTMPARWQSLKIAIGKGTLYCQYAAIAGAAGSSAHIGTKGTLMYSDASGNLVAPPTVWFYLMAQCDWDNDPTINAKYWQRGDLSELGRDNEQR